MFSTLPMYSGSDPFVGEGLQFWCSAQKTVPDTTSFVHGLSAASFGHWQSGLPVFSNDPPLKGIPNVVVDYLAARFSVRFMGEGTSSLTGASELCCCWALPPLSFSDSLMALNSSWTCFTLIRSIEFMK